ncbi:hypothetical protein [Maricaulis sp. W15]|nr:hypothetical protein [Maricaulis sp. W15]
MTVSLLEWDGRDAAAPGALCTATACKTVCQLSLDHVSEDVARSLQLVRH